MAPAANQGNLNQSDTIGGVNIELLLKDDRFVRDLEAAVQRSRTGGQQIDQSFQRATGSDGAGESGVKGFSKALRGAHELTVGLVARFAAVGAAAAMFYNLGRTIRVSIEDRLKSASELAGDFVQKLDMADRKGSISALNKEIAELEQRLAELTSDGGGLPGFLNRNYMQAIYGNAERINGQLETLRKQRQSLTQSERAEEARKKSEDERKQSEDAVQAIKKEIDARTLASLEGEAKVFEQRRQDIERLSELEKKAGPGNAEMIEDLRYLIESDAWSKRMQEMSKTFKEGQQFALELRRASQEWRQAQVGAFGANDIVVEIRQVRELLTRIALQSRGTGSL